MADTTKLKDAMDNLIKAHIDFVEEITTFDIEQHKRTALELCITESTKLLFGIIKVIALDIESFENAPKIRRPANDIIV